VHKSRAPGHRGDYTLYGVLNKKLAAFTPLAPGIRKLFVPVQQFVIFVAVCNIFVAHIAGGTQAEVV
jgi:hypothetical protein